VKLRSYVSGLGQDPVEDCCAYGRYAPRIFRCGGGGLTVGQYIICVILKYML
jgi:hypothetical protein